MGLELPTNQNPAQDPRCIDEARKGQERAARCAEAAETSREIETSIAENRKWLAREQDELNHNINQAHELFELKERLELLAKSLEGPLRISQENLYSRQFRQVGEKMELPLNNVEVRLDHEIKTFTNWQDRLKKVGEKVNSQLKALVDSRHDIEGDILTKTKSKNMEACVQLLCAISRDIGPLDLPAVTLTKERSNSWIKVTKDLIDNSVKVRESSQLVRVEINQEMCNCANECFNTWYETNAFLTNKIKDLILAQEQIVRQYSKVMLDIETLSPRLAEVREAVDEKTPHLKIAQARVEKRKNIIGLELCYDNVAMTLFRELHVLKMDVNRLTLQLTETESTMQTLVRSKERLEKELRLNDTAIFVNRDRCLYLRQSFPMTSFKEFRYPTPKMTTKSEEFR